MTIEELMKVFNRAKWDLLRAGDYESLDRAGVVAIVRAMRDEIWMRTKRMDACDILLEILGPIEGQGAAKESGGRDRKYGPAQVGGGAPSPTYYIPAEDWWARFMNARIVVVHGCDAGEKVAGKDTAMPEAIERSTPATDPIPNALPILRQAHHLHGGQIMTDKEVAARLKRFVDAYDVKNPLREADMHNLECQCNRCLFDFIRSAAERLAGRK